MNLLTFLLDSHFPSAKLPFLFAAFAVTWAIFFAYAFFVSRRRQEMQREIAELHREVEQEKSAVRQISTPERAFGISISGWILLRKTVVGCGRSGS